MYVDLQAKVQNTREKEVSGNKKINIILNVINL